ncbi:MAG: hypothetical protein EA362_04970 [Saprospirales bacterium]|nr:MAG: hypothetical protein EA362_04970 [Saprospirales bacterium]
MSATYGLRSDIFLIERWGLIAGIYAENLDYSFYGGPRFEIVPDFLELILTYGQGFNQRIKMPGFAIQLSFTPEQLW